MASNTIAIQDVTDILEEFAPLGLAESWDAVGLQVGDPRQPCRAIAVGLDLTLSTLETALTYEADLIITHHPLLFRPTTAIRFDQAQGHLIQRLCAEKISYYAMHTNLDSTVGGLNDQLAATLELTDCAPLLAPPETTPAALQDKGVGLGRLGRLQKGCTLKQLGSRLQEALSPESLRIIGHEHDEVSLVALCTGSGGSLMNEAIASGADCFVTGDVKYHQALDAQSAGMAVLDVGHYASEIGCIPLITSLLNKRFGDDLQIIALDNAVDPLRNFD